MQTGLYAYAGAAAFLGAAIYIGSVEHPARLKLGVRAMVREWSRGHLALRRSDGEKSCAGARVDAGLGFAGVGLRPDRVGRLRRICMGTAAVAVIRD
jgi:hypothetical protein